MNQQSLKTLIWIRNIIIAVGIAGGLIIWLRVPSMIANNGFLHVGNGQLGSKIGLLILLPFPLLSLLAGKGQDAIHGSDETERTRLEDERKRATVRTQICYAIGEVIVVLGLMLAGTLL